MEVHDHAVPRFLLLKKSFACKMCIMFTQRLHFFLSELVLGDLFPFQVISTTILLIVFVTYRKVILQNTGFARLCFKNTMQKPCTRSGMAHPSTPEKLAHRTHRTAHRRRGVGPRGRRSAAPRAARRSPRAHG